MAKWGVLGCGWGDAIVSLSNLYKNDCRKVIYLGKYKEIIPFLEAQDYIDEAKYIEFLPSEEGYWGAFLELAVRRDEKILDRLVQYFNLDNKDQYINCQLGFKGGKGILELVDKVNFSQRAIEESERIKKEFELEDFIIFQPTSFHSTPPENFYPYWDDVFKKTLELYPDKQIVLIGEQQSNLDVNHKKFIDLRGKFSTAESIAHLAVSSDLVITLSNNLIYFCHMFDVPTINFCNKEFDVNLAFRRSMCKKTMINVDWRAPKEEAYYVLENWQNIINKNTFYKIRNHIDFLSKFVVLTYDTVMDTLKVDYYEEFHKIFIKYVDEDWYFSTKFPPLVALYSLHFNLGSGCTHASTGMEESFQISHAYLSKKTTMLRKVDEVSKDFILFITSQELLNDKRFWGCKHIVCLNNSEDGKLKSYFENHGFEVETYKDLVFDARCV